MPISESACGLRNSLHHPGNAGLNFLAALLWLVSAVLWAFGALVKIRNSQDAFIDDLRRAGNWNSWAAGTACAAALVSGIVALSEVFR